MSTLLQSVLSGNNGALVQQLAGQFGLNGSQIEAAIGQLVPALSGAVKRNTTEPQGVEALMAALQSGNHARYVDEPATLASAATEQDGNNILGHLFGSKEVSREVASRASAQTGIGSEILKKMLPIIATTVMGSLAKQAFAGDNTSGSSSLVSGLINSALGGSASSGAMGMLSGFLDADKDGSMVDDIMGMLAKRAS